ncbi:PREDICTED: DNA ligase 1-like [Polistes canadensis]|uniref:DNA ligase 1-like n=1 Tax=Polistes canadensis TaxID=91411 RepID=UPI000718ED63|nr:PREDICTED: DNA ligase 1-like [Polistes canadensis]
MIYVCELLTEEPKGGSAMICLRTFLNLYGYLANLDCSGEYLPIMKEQNEEEIIQSTDDHCHSYLSPSIFKLCKYSDSTMSCRQNICASQENIHEEEECLCVYEENDKEGDEVKGDEKNEVEELEEMDVIESNSNVEKKNMEQVLYDSKIKISRKLDETIDRLVNEKNEEVDEEEEEEVEEKERKNEKGWIVEENSKNAAEVCDCSIEYKKIIQEKEKEREDKKVEKEMTQEELDYSQVPDRYFSEEQSVDLNLDEFGENMEQEEEEEEMEESGERVWYQMETMENDSGEFVDAFSDVCTCPKREQPEHIPTTPTPSKEAARSMYDPVEEFIKRMETEIEKGRLKRIFRIDGIGPVVSEKQVTAVGIWLGDCARRQEGLVGPRNIKHFLCPDLQDPNSDCQSR